jgi:hypothetical protein
MRLASLSILVSRTRWRVVSRGDPTRSDPPSPDRSNPRARDSSSNCEKAWDAIEPRLVVSSCPGPIQPRPDSAPSPPRKSNVQCIITARGVNRSPDPRPSFINALKRSCWKIASLSTRSPQCHRTTGPIASFENLKLKHDMGSNLTTSGLPMKSLRHFRVVFVSGMPVNQFDQQERESVNSFTNSKTRSA